MFCHRAFVCGTGAMGDGAGRGEGTADWGDGADDCIRGIVGAGVGIGIGFGAGGGLCDGDGLGDGPADDGTGGGLGLVDSSIFVAIGIVSGIVGVSRSDGTLSEGNKAS